MGRKVEELMRKIEMPFSVTRALLSKNLEAQTFETPTSIVRFVRDHLMPGARN
jgi:hypothetical protein